MCIRDRCHTYLKKRRCGVCLSTSRGASGAIPAHFRAKCPRPSANRRRLRRRLVLARRSERRSRRRRRAFTSALDVSTQGAAEYQRVYTRSICSIRARLLVWIQLDVPPQVALSSLQGLQCKSHCVLPSTRLLIVDSHSVISFLETRVAARCLLIRQSRSRGYSPRRARGARGTDVRVLLPSIEV